MTNNLIEENVPTFGSKTLVINNRKRLCYLIKCGQCDIEHYKEEHELTRGIRRNKKFFCSRDCRNNYSKTTLQKICTFCTKQFNVKLSVIIKSKTGNLFCSSSCSATYNNSKRIKKVKQIKLKITRIKLPYKCRVCESIINSKRLYCDSCNHDARLIDSKKYWKIKFDEYINSWKAGKISGSRGEGVVSAHIRKYIFIKYESKCSECEWSKINPITNNIPLEIDHIDGDWNNHKEDNLRLLCPSCHSLTPTYKSLNNGRGRTNRKFKRQSNN